MTPPVIATPETGTLLNLAEVINREHQAASHAAASVLTHARRAGEALIAAKVSQAHGAWLPWLVAHCPDVSARTAQGYMRVAREWPRLEALVANTQRVSHLPVREALALLAEPAIPPDPEICGEIDWPSRAAAMDAAWDDLTAQLDELNARAPATSIEEAWDRLQAAEALEHRTIALSVSTHRDARHALRALARLLHLTPVRRVRVLTNPEAIETFLAVCRERIAELSAASGSGSV